MQPILLDSIPADPTDTAVDRHWTLHDPAPQLIEPFGSLDRVFQLEGEYLTRCPVSELLRVEISGRHYYVKRYYRRGKHLRAVVGRSRVQAEWENLQCFQRWGIATATLVGYGQHGWGRAYRGAVITAELPHTEDLESIARRGDPRMKDRNWVARVSEQLAAATRVLHQRRFAHNDLKWRNILVDVQGKVYLIDCPGGRFWWGPFLCYRIAKDLACLDKVARQYLSRTQRLRFYLDYHSRTHLSAADRRPLRQVLQFFDGRS